MANHVCPHCRSQLPVYGEPYCPSCRQSLDDFWDEMDRQDDRPPTILSLRGSEDSGKPTLYEFALKLHQFTPYTPITPLLIILNCAVFVFMVLRGASFFRPDIDTLLKFGANFAPLSLKDEPWRLFTCMFIHIGALHLAVNMWCLFVVGKLVERFLGCAGFLTMYLLSGLTGSLVSVVWSPQIVSAGASGAIFGVFGATLGIYLRAAQTIPDDFLKANRAAMLRIIALNLAIGFMVPGISMSAHLGGLAGGFLCGLALGHPFRADAAGGVRFVTQSSWCSVSCFCLCRIWRSRIEWEK